MSTVPQKTGPFETPATALPHISNATLTLHEESNARIAVPAERLFDQLDDPTRLTAHMSTRSWRMGWGKMDTALDDRGGRAVGSHIIVRGRIFGIRLYLDEVVTQRETPFRKTWETVGEPRLLVIGSYRMGFTVTRTVGGSSLRVTIDYALPTTGVSRVLGWAFGRTYAKWCTRRMVQDVEHMFA